MMWDSQRGLVELRWRRLFLATVLMRIALRLHLGFLERFALSVVFVEHRLPGGKWERTNATWCKR
jgi:hypothetical protein